ncbi:hypothetical protein OA90_12965 [Labrenzia sp. OB1]|nr:hypothetical protein OA90_12965 [Labrenzia sp. OB1]
MVETVQARIRQSFPAFVPQDGFKVRHAGISADLRPMIYRIGSEKSLRQPDIACNQVRKDK